MGNLQPEKVAFFASVDEASSIQRTEWAERKVEGFLSLPFISEFVFRDVRTSERLRQEQVADFLIIHGGAGILIELKCQEDPSLRTPAKQVLWARKRAREGWNQIRRAFTRSREFPIWCEHARRGRVEFPDGLPPIQHGVVTPITYLSVNDFLNLADHLRSVPELTDYLTARRTLPEVDLLKIGEEKKRCSAFTC